MVSDPLPSNHLVQVSRPVPVPLTVTVPPGAFRSSPAKVPAKISGMGGAIGGGKRSVVPSVSGYGSSSASLPLRTDSRRALAVNGVKALSTAYVDGHGADSQYFQYSSASGRSASPTPSASASNRYTASSVSLSAPYNGYKPAASHLVYEGSDEAVDSYVPQPLIKHLSQIKIETEQSGGRDEKSVKVLEWRDEVADGTGNRCAGTGADVGNGVGVSRITSTLTDGAADLIFDQRSEMDTQTQSENQWSELEMRIEMHRESEREVFREIVGRAA